MLGRRDGCIEGPQLGWDDGRIDGFEEGLDGQADG